MTKHHTDDKTNQISKIELSAQNNSTLSHANHGMEAVIGSSSIRAPPPYRTSGHVNVYESAKANS